MDDPLSEFQEGQWWVAELDKAAGSVGAADDFKRAVAVVHHMLRSAADALAQPAAQREACAKLCDAVAKASRKHDDLHVTLEKCSRLIRSGVRYRE